MYLLGRINEPGSKVYVAEKDEAVVGFIILQIDTDDDAPYGVLQDILVNPAFRGQGIGHELIEKGMAWLRKQGITDFYLESGVDNHKAHAFFHKLGFRVISHTFKMKRTECADPEAGYEKDGNEN